MNERQEAWTTFLINEQVKAGFTDYQPQDLAKTIWNFSSRLRISGEFTKMSKCKKTSIFFEENLKLFKMLSKLLKLLMNFKKVQNQTSNQASINQKVNGNLKRKRRKRSHLWPSRCAAGKNEWAWADFFSNSILIIQHWMAIWFDLQGYAL